jgi:alpha-galactosidase
MEDGSKAVGLFNRGENADMVTARWTDIGIKGKQKVRDLWRQKDIGVFQDEYKVQVPRHGVALIRIWPAGR